MAIRVSRKSGRPSMALDDYHRPFLWERGEFSGRAVTPGSSSPEARFRCCSRTRGQGNSASWRAGTVRQVWRLLRLCRFLAGVYGHRLCGLAAAADQRLDLLGQLRVLSQELLGLLAALTQLLLSEGVERALFLDDAGVGSQIDDVTLAADA